METTRACQPAKYESITIGDDESLAEREKSEPDHIRDRFTTNAHGTLPRQKEDAQARTNPLQHHGKKRGVGTVARVPGHEKTSRQKVLDYSFIGNFNTMQKNARTIRER
jgi:hypothetical protein